MTAAAPVEHWYDFICPFCYIAQDRNRILREAGVDIVERGFAIHPEIPPGGQLVGPRRGPMYDNLRREADDAGLPLVWGERIAYSRSALVRSELVRLREPNRHARFVAAVFDAYFGRGLDIESPQVLDDCVESAEVPAGLFEDAALATGEDSLLDSMRSGHEHGVTGTPAWLVQGRLLTGLRDRADFEQLAGTLRG